MWENDALTDNEILETVVHVRTALESWEHAGHEVIPVRVVRELFHELSPGRIDLIVNLCEGFGGNPRGEAWVAGLIELTGIPYTGSDPLTLSLCLNKGMTKDLLVAHGIPTPPYRVVSHPGELSDVDLSFPLMVKPACEDASIGITSGSVVKEPGALRRQVDHLLERYGPPVLVEEYIHGRELNVSIIGSGDEARVLPISEILFTGPAREGEPDIVDFEAKWIDGSEPFLTTNGRCPADLPDDVRTAVENIALEAYRVTGCRDYARVDFRLQGDHPYVLEINPNPGINMDSGFVRSARAAGMEYGDLVRYLVHEAVRRAGLPTSDLAEPDIPVPAHPRKWRTDHLTAERVAMKHIPLLIRWFNDDSISRYMENPVASYSEEYLIRKFLLNGTTETDLIIRHEDSRRYIGYACIYNMDREAGSGEVSFLIGEPEFLGKGLGREIARLLIEVGFQDLGLSTLFASICAENPRPLQIFRSLGFRQIGRRTGHHVHGGKRYDDVLFELVKQK